MSDDSFTADDREKKKKIRKYLKTACKLIADQAKKRKKPDDDGDADEKKMPPKRRKLIF